MIISPLVALMKDQTNLFKGISTDYVSDKYATDEETQRRVLHGQL